MRRDERRREKEKREGEERREKQKGREGRSIERLGKKKIESIR